MHPYTREQVRLIWVSFLAFLGPLPVLAALPLAYAGASSFVLYLVAASVLGHLFAMLHGTATHLFVEHELAIWWEDKKDWPWWAEELQQLHGIHHRVEGALHGKTGKGDLEVRSVARFSSLLRLRVVGRQLLFGTLMFALVLTPLQAFDLLSLEAVVGATFGFGLGTILWMAEYELGHAWTHREDWQEGVVFGPLYRLFHSWIHKLHHKDDSAWYAIYAPGAMVELYPHIAFWVFRRLPS